MSTERAGRTLRIAGGAAAPLVAFWSLTLVVFAILRRLMADMPEIASVLPLFVGLASALIAVGQLLVLVAVHPLLQPASWVTRLGVAGGVAGALTNLAVPVFLLAGDRGTADLLVELAPVGVGVWALCTAAAAWRLRVWPAWLRVAGATFGAAAMIQPGFPPAALIALLAGLVWWFSLGFQLLRGPRSTGG